MAMTTPHPERLEALLEATVHQARIDAGAGDAQALAWMRLAVPRWAPSPRGEPPGWVLDVACALRQGADVRDAAWRYAARSGARGVYRAARQWPVLSEALAARQERGG